MAFVYDTSARYPADTTLATRNASVNITPGVDAKLIVLGIVDSSAFTRRGTIPTFGGNIFTQVGPGQQRAASSPEVGCELWYYLNPSVGAAYSVNVQGDVSMNLAIKVISFCVSTSGTSYKDRTVAFDVSVGSNNTSANPGGTIRPTYGGGIAVQMVASGSNAPPTAYTHTKMHALDHGTYCSEMQMYLLPDASFLKDVSMTMTLAADDWGSIIGVWKPTYLPGKIKSISNVPDACINKCSSTLYSTVLAVEQIGN